MKNLDEMNILEKIDYIVNDFQEPKDKYTVDFYLNEIIKVNFQEFEKAEDTFLEYKKLAGNYENYIRTAFNLAVSIDNLRDWLKLEPLNCQKYGLQLIYNIANSIKHKIIERKNKNKYLDDVYDLKVIPMTPFYGIDKRLDHILRVSCKTDNLLVKEAADFKKIAESAINELEQHIKLSD
ncbi:MAG: hypothetical protein A2039_06880 [Candidatus Melainabacteria bacterium GWA2_34_9]|nr:MAG: hypothetical protein A2039_06880 [Candidatus Melainabacteria bacterium GWA2_34_9]